MKKFGAFLFVSTLLLTGCGKNNKVTCSGTQEEGGKKFTTEITATLKDDKVNSLSSKMTFGDEESAKEYCGMLALASSFTSNENEKIDYKCDGKSVTINNFENLVSDDDDDKIIGLTKQEFIDEMTKSAKEEGTEITCK